MIGIGQLLQGWATSNLVVLSLPEMINQANIAFPGRPDEINDYCSGIFNSCLGIGQISGPLVGSYVTLSLGFRYTEDIAALVNFAYFVFYISIA
jgi:hypothetical protein